MSVQAPEKTSTAAIAAHPMENFLRMDRMPHIWCPGCGIGTVTNCIAGALQEEKYDLDKVAVVSGIGCSGRVAGYVKLDSFHTTHGRAIAFATGLALGNPRIKVLVVSGDGDLSGIGGNHLIHACRRNINMTIVCINNFIYGMTGGQLAPTTPIGGKSTTSPFGAYEHPFNLPHLAASSGATYVARWTVLHYRRLTNSIAEALNHKGFSFVEAIAPCPTTYQRRNKLGDGADTLKFYHDNIIIEHEVDTKDIGIGFQTPLKLGKFVHDTAKPDYLEQMNSHLSKALGDKYTLWGKEFPTMDGGE